MTNANRTLTGGSHGIFSLSLVVSNERIVTPATTAAHGAFWAKSHASLWGFMMLIQVHNKMPIQVCRRANGKAPRTIPSISKSRTFDLLAIPKNPDLTHDIAKLARGFIGNVTHPFDANINGFTQPGFEVANDARLFRCAKGWPSHDLDDCLIQRQLLNFETLNARQVAHCVDQCQAVHDSTVSRDDEVGRAPLHFFQNG